MDKSTLIGLSVIDDFGTDKAGYPQMKRIRFDWSNNRHCEAVILPPYTYDAVMIALKNALWLVCQEKRLENENIKSPEKISLFTMRSDGSLVLDRIEYREKNND